MIPYIVGGALVGLVFAKRSAPVAKFKKLELLGPQTGVSYKVDVCPGGQVIIVHTTDGTSALFQKIAGSPGYTLLRQLTGRRDIVELMRKDLEPAKLPPPEKVPNAATG